MHALASNSVKSMVDPVMVRLKQWFALFRRSILGARVKELDPQALAWERHHKVRWSSNVARMTKVAMKNWTIAHTVLNEEEGPVQRIASTKVASVRADLEDPLFKAKLAVMADVFGYMSGVSTFLQTRSLTCRDVESAMQTAQYHLRSLAKVGGVEEWRVREGLPQSQQDDIASWRKMLCRKLRKDLKKRWESQSASFKHARLLDRSHPEEHQAESLLAYCEACGINDSNRRFAMLSTWKNWVLTNSLKSDLAQSAMSDIHGADSDLNSVLEALLVSSPSSVEVERGFSTVTFLRTRWRTKLHLSTLESLMMLYLQGPPISDKDACASLVDNALLTFRSAKPRRYKKRNFVPREKSCFEDVFRELCRMAAEEPDFEDGDESDDDAEEQGAVEPEEDHDEEDEDPDVEESLLLSDVPVPSLAPRQ